jgi:hypothetical protein
MPTLLDAKGKELKVGDKVVVRGTIHSLSNSGAMAAVALVERILPENTQQYMMVRALQIEKVD